MDGELGGGMARKGVGERKGKEEGRGGRGRIHMCTQRPHRWTDLNLNPNSYRCEVLQTLARYLVSESLRFHIYKLGIITSI